MKPAVYLLSLLVLGAGVLPAVAASDTDCVDRLDSTATRARRTVAVYTTELQGMTMENPYAGSAASICDGALSRADRYYAKETKDNAVCGTSTSYVDNQVEHLYNRAVSTCRDEFETQLRRLPDEAQADTGTRVSQKLSAIR